MRVQGLGDLGLRPPSSTDHVFTLKLVVLRIRSGST